jgi:hypothetical protein
VAFLVYLLVIVVAWFLPAVRNVETILPDHDQAEKAAEAAAA